MTDTTDIAALVAIIDNAVLDWDGTQEVDGAEPVRIPNCGQLRAMKAALERLARENYRLTRMAEARAQQPDWEKLWAEVVAERDALAAKLEQAERMAETSKGYPTDVSLKINALRSTGEKSRD